MELPPDAVVQPTLVWTPHPLLSPCQIPVISKMIATIPPAHFHKPVRNEGYESREDGMKRLQDYAYATGFLLTVSRSTKERVSLICAHGENYKSTRSLPEGITEEADEDGARRKKELHTRKTQCPYSIHLSYKDFKGSKQKRWYLVITRDYHNHEMAIDPHSYPEHRRRHPDYVEARAHAVIFRTTDKTYRYWRECWLAANPDSKLFLSSSDYYNLKRTQEVDASRMKPVLVACKECRIRKRKCEHKQAIVGDMAEPGMGTRHEAEGEGQFTRGCGISGVGDGQPESSNSVRPRPRNPKPWDPLQAGLHKNLHEVGPKLISRSIYGTPYPSTRTQWVLNQQVEESQQTVHGEIDKTVALPMFVHHHGQSRGQPVLSPPTSPVHYPSGLSARQEVVSPLVQNLESPTTRQQMISPPSPPIQPSSEQSISQGLISPSPLVGHSRSSSSQGLISPGSSKRQRLISPPSPSSLVQGLISPPVRPSLLPNKNQWAVKSPIPYHSGAGQVAPSPNHSRYPSSEPSVSEREKSPIHYPSGPNMPFSHPSESNTNQGLVSPARYLSESATSQGLISPVLYPSEPSKNQGLVSPVLNPSGPIVRKGMLPQIYQPPPVRALSPQYRLLGAVERQTMPSPFIYHHSASFETQRVWSPIYDQSANQGTVLPARLPPVSGVNEREIPPTHYSSGPYTSKTRMEPDHCPSDLSGRQETLPASIHPAGSVAAQQQQAPLTYHRPGPNAMSEMLSQMQHASVSSASFSQPPMHPTPGPAANGGMMNIVMWKPSNKLPQLKPKDEIQNDVTSTLGPSTDSPTIAAAEPNAGKYADKQDPRLWAFPGDPRGPCRDRPEYPLGTFIVGGIIDHRVNPKTGEIQYKIKWEEYPEEDASYEPVWNLLGDPWVESLLEQYHLSNGMKNVLWGGKDGYVKED